eukprot:11934780-Karenia_brevis.AAC.1
MSPALDFIDGCDFGGNPGPSAKSFQADKFWSFHILVTLIFDCLLAIGDWAQQIRAQSAPA